MKRRTLSTLQKSPRLKAIVSRALRADKDPRVGASGDMRDFALLIAEETMMAEQARVGPAIDLAIRFIEGERTLNPGHILRKLRAARVRST